jgi:hypothetical protein
MIIDEAFIGRFKNQIGVLTNLRDAAQGALDRANVKYAKLNEKANFGKNVEDVLGPMQLKRSPGGPSKDQKSK